MTKTTFSKIRSLEARHPGVFRQLSAMFDASIPLRTIAAALEAQYGERIPPACLEHFRRTLKRPPAQPARHKSAGAS
jgi:hypothetical protein